MSYRNLLLLLLQVFLPLTVHANTAPVLLTTIHGDSVGDSFCIAEGVGDVNGDGIPDFVVGAPNGEYANLYFGREPFDTVADVVFTPPWGEFGSTIASADFNGDGFSDIAIGRPTYTGSVDIFFGGISVNAECDLRLRGDYDGSRFGEALAAVGDVNNDGYQDLAVGAPTGYDPSGRAYIFFGSSAMDTIPDVYMEGPIEGSEFGNSIHKIGDINGDNYDDMLIGAPGWLAYPTQMSKLYLIYGGEEISLQNAEIVYQDSFPSYYVDSVTGMGDMNSDGLSDFVMATTGTFLIFTDTSPTQVALDPVPGSTGYITGGEDFDGDSINDLLISFASQEGQYAALVNGYLGSAVMEGRPSFTLEGNFGSHISFAGDINNDGYNEFLIGAAQMHGELGPGRVSIYTFNPDLGIESGAADKVIPESSYLYQNYPNPFNSNTTISYELRQSSNIILEIFDCQGRHIRKLVSDHQSPGIYTYSWDGKTDHSRIITSGIFFMRMITIGDLTHTRECQIRKLMYLK